MSKRIPFNVKFRPQIESGDYKVKTRDGRPARIICWDMISDEPIIALVAGDPNDKTDTSEYILTCFEKGNYYTTKESENDLFIVTPDPEMSEWQTFISGCLQKHGLLDCGAADRIAKESAAELLSLAKQQLLQSGELMTQEHHEMLMETLREECKKGLPRWKKFVPNINDPLSEQQICAELENCVMRVDIGGYCWIINREELNKLPKEDESHE